MTGGMMEFLYRAMIEENGMPRRGSSATALGVRPGKDIEIDDQGNVHRPEFHQGQRNGVSCAPSIRELPEFAIPSEYGGFNKRTRVWRIAVADLGLHLIAEQDGPGHISIGPAHTMSFDKYSEAIQATASDWELVLPTGNRADAIQE